MEPIKFLCKNTPPDLPFHAIPKIYCWKISQIYRFNYKKTYRIRTKQKRGCGTYTTLKILELSTAEGLRNIKTVENNKQLNWRKRTTKCVHDTTRNFVIFFLFVAIFCAECRKLNRYGFQFGVHIVFESVDIWVTCWKFRGESELFGYNFDLKIRWVEIYLRNFMFWEWDLYCPFIKKKHLLNLSHFIAPP